MRIHFMALVREPGDEAGLAQNLREVDPAVSLDVLAGAASITSGYNALFRRARGVEAELLCFLHDDARLWFDFPRVIPRYFAERLPRPGVVGFIGCERIGLDSRWWVHPPYRGSVVWGPAPDADRAPPLDYGGVEPGGYRAVDAVDGYCLFVARETFERLGGFDERYRRWHCYDADLCVAALAAGYQNYVIGEPSSHVGGGSLAQPWEMENVKWLFKWGPFLQRRG
jgi:hypothetical protein